MKRIWLILLSLGLVMAFSVSALAVDIKVGGEFYVGGMYLNKTNVNDVSYDSKGVDYVANVSTAFLYQRLRVGTDFIVSPCLKLVTRIDAMERIWGGTRSNTWLENQGGYNPLSAQTNFENENIAVDWAYINYVSPIGTFDVGYMNDGSTGTIFGNTYSPAGRIKYSYSKDAYTLNLAYTKVSDNSYSAVTANSYTGNVPYWTDADKDKYGIEGVYKWKDGKAGLQINYYRYADKRPASDYMTKYFLFTPYVMAKIGPVALQAEFNWATGDSKEYETSATDVKLDQMSGWIDATATFAPVYVGATFAYVSGDNPGTTDNVEGGSLNGGADWNPCLIMFNYYDTGFYAGTVSGYGGTKVTGPMSNALFFQGRIGAKPIPELDAMLSISYANADKKPSGYPSGEYGWEVDLTGTYKITNNLSYMLGVGYLFTGDYFKATDVPDTKVNDDVLVINKLTLTF